jgi:hypothetical protein
MIMPLSCVHLESNAISYKATPSTMYAYEYSATAPSIFFMGKVRNKATQTAIMSIEVNSSKMYVKLISTFVGS